MSTYVKKGYRVKAERNAEIVRLVDEGLRTLDDIGEEYGITRERVRQLAKRAGIVRNNIPVPNKPRLRYMPKCIHCGVRIPEGTQRQHNWTENHRTSKNAKITPSMVGPILEAYEAGLGYRTISRALGFVGFNGIKHYVNKYGKVVPHKRGEYDRNREARQVVIDRLKEQLS